MSSPVMIDTLRKELVRKFESSITLLQNISRGVILNNRKEFTEKVHALQYAWENSKEKLLQATTTDEVIVIKNQILSNTEHNKSGTDLAASFITHHAYMLYEWETKQ